MDQKQLIVKMVFDRWNTLLGNLDALLDTLTDERIEREVSPGKNHGSWLLGHLVAVHDDMLALLNLGEKQHAQLYDLYIKSPDRSANNNLPVPELRRIWKEQLQTLGQKFAGLTAEEWFQRHNAVSAADFAAEPHRNKLNIILTRTTHLAYHAGQLALLK